MNFIDLFKNVNSISKFIKILKELNKSIYNKEIWTKLLSGFVT